MQVLIAKIGAEYASRVQLDVLQHFRTAVACWQATEAELPWHTRLLTAIANLISS